MPDRQTLSRAERLRTLSVIRRLFSEGESRFVYPFRVVWLSGEPAKRPEAAQVDQPAETAGDSAAAAVSGTGATTGITGVIATTGITEAVATTKTGVTEGTGAVSGAVAADTASPAHAPQLRVLFSVPKKFHKRANRRNLLRRRTKEAYRLQKSALQLRKPYDIALIYTSREVENYARIAHAVRKIIALLNALDR